jgi:hypothetical protein
MAHSPDCHEFRITDHGIEVLGVYDCDRSESPSKASATPRARHVHALGVAACPPSRFPHVHSGKPLWLGVRRWSAVCLEDPDHKLAIPCFDP